MRLELTITGDEAAERHLDTMGDRAVDARPVWNVVAGLVMRETRRQFALGSGWAPLAASTRERKARQHKPAQAMVDSGALRASLTRRGARGQILDLQRDEMRLGTRIFYARFHQRGKGVPERKVLDLTPAVKRRISRDLADHIVGAA